MIAEVEDVAVAELRQSDFDLASDRNVGTKSKRQLQRERDDLIGEESQAGGPEGGE